MELHQPELYLQVLRYDGGSSTPRPSSTPLNSSSLAIEIAINVLLRDFEIPVIYLPLKVNLLHELKRSLLLTAALDCLGFLVIYRGRANTGTPRMEKLGSQIKTSPLNIQAPLPGPSSTLRVLPPLFHPYGIYSTPRARDQGMES